jgi:hypothetical protein
MSEDWEYTEQQDKAKDEVREKNESNATIADDHELKGLPDNYEEQDKVVEADAAIKSLPRATSTATDSIDKRKKDKLPLRKQKQQQRRVSDVPKQLQKQGIEIKKLKLILQSQSQLNLGVIKQLKSQLKQVMKQNSKIQKHVANKKKRK